MSSEGTRIKDTMKAIAVGDESGIGTAAAVGARDRVTKNADSSFKKRVDMSFQGCLAGR